MENIFGYLKGQKNATTLSNYRVVCKVWDHEIVRFLRKDTKINLTSILSPYPVGMGWIQAPADSDSLFNYEAPYSEVQSYRNITVNAKSCDKLKNSIWEKWFEFMGKDVKSLTFSAPFSCFCQHVFLERILKQWCPGLETLELKNVGCPQSLFTTSSFIKLGTDFICKDLKHLKIDFDSRAFVGEAEYLLCTDQNNHDNRISVIRSKTQHIHAYLVYLTVYNLIINRKIKSMFPTLPSSMDLGDNIRLPDHLLRAQPLPDLSPYFTESLINSDGGIVGQIMKHINVEKLSYNGVYELSSRNQSLVSLFHLRPNKLRVSLKHLELMDFSDFSRQLVFIGEVKFPLTRIKIDGIHANYENHVMTRFLANFSSTLRHLEIGGPTVRKNDEEIQSELRLPNLPKLQTFVHENILKSYVSPDNLWGMAPKLNMCSLHSSSLSKWHANKFFHKSINFSSNFMTELKISATISGKQAELLLNWFPNLFRMELILDKFGKGARGFFVALGNSKVEHLNISFLRCHDSKRDKVGERRSAVLWEAENIKGDLL